MRLRAFLNCVAVSVLIVITICSDAAADSCSPSNSPAGVVWADDWRPHDYLQRSITVPIGYRRLTGSVRYATDVNHTDIWYDTFTVTARSLLPSQSVTLLSADLPHLVFGPGDDRWAHITAPFNYGFDCRAGEIVTLRFGVDIHVDPNATAPTKSGIIVSPVRFVRTDKWVPVTTGGLIALANFSGDYGPLLAIKVENTNILPGNVNISAMASGFRQSSGWQVVPVKGSYTHYFSQGGATAPLHWDVMLTSQTGRTFGTTLVYTAYSNWVTGMPKGDQCD